MSRCFVIEDEWHSEQVGKYTSLDEAWKELKRRATIEWNRSPNVAPCMSWETCGRNYEIIEYEDSVAPWEVVRRITGLVIDSTGLIWGAETPAVDNDSSA